MVGSGLMLAIRSTLGLVDALVGEARVEARSRDGALVAQAALVRAILDEVGRYDPSDRRVMSLQDQLGEQLLRLVELAPVAASHTTEAAVPVVPVEVLVVDDDPRSLRLASLVVRDSGYPCRTTSSAADALREFEQQPAAIVLSDWDMPAMDGLELCRALKSRASHVHTILVTAHDDASLRRSARGTVDAFLTKPMDLDELSRRLTVAGRLNRVVLAAESARDELRARGCSG